MNLPWTEHADPWWAEASVGTPEENDGVRFTLHHQPTCYRRGPYCLRIDASASWGCFDVQDQPVRYYHDLDRAFAEAAAIAGVLAVDRYKDDWRRQGYGPWERLGQHQWIRRWNNEAAPAWFAALITEPGGVYPVDFPPAVGWNVYPVDFIPGSIPGRDRVQRLAFGPETGEDGRAKADAILEAYVKGSP